MVISWELFYILAAMEKGLKWQFFCCREPDSNDGIRKRSKAAARLINEVAAEAQEGKMIKLNRLEWIGLVAIVLVLLLGIAVIVGILGLGLVPNIPTQTRGM